MTPFSILRLIFGLSFPVLSSLPNGHIQVRRPGRFRLRKPSQLRGRRWFFFTCAGLPDFPRDNNSDDTPSGIPCQGCGIGGHMLYMSRPVLKRTSLPSLQDGQKQRIHKFCIHLWGICMSEYTEIRGSFSE
jgi:hypothetical protein